MLRSGVASETRQRQSRRCIVPDNLRNLYNLKLSVAKHYAVAIVRHATSLDWKRLVAVTIVRGLCFAQNLEIKAFSEIGLRKFRRFQNLWVVTHQEERRLPRDRIVW